MARPGGRRSVVAPRVCVSRSGRARRGVRRRVPVGSPWGAGPGGPSPRTRCGVPSGRFVRKSGVACTGWVATRRSGGGLTRAGDGGTAEAAHVLLSPRKPVPSSGEREQAEVGLRVQRAHPAAMGESRCWSSGVLPEEATRQHEVVPNMTRRLVERIRARSGGRGDRGDRGDVARLTRLGGGDRGYGVRDAGEAGMFDVRFGAAERPAVAGARRVRCGAVTSGTSRSDSTATDGR